MAPDHVVREEVPIACTGEVTVRGVGVEVGDAISVHSAFPASWRVVVQAPGREPFNATTLSEIGVADPTQDEVLRIDSESGLPDYRPIRTGGGVLAPEAMGQAIQRPGYHVRVSCAGPVPLRYALGRLYDEQNPPDPLPEDLAATEVECDGAVHDDDLDIPFPDASRFLVTADSRTAWRIVLTADKPPIDLAPDDGGWTMSTGFGPNYLTGGGDPETVDMIAEAHGDPIRIVIRCSGEARLTGTIDAGTALGTRLDPYSLDCSTGEVLERIYEDAAPYTQVLFDAHHGAIWLAITGQVKGPAVPVP